MKMMRLSCITDLASNLSRSSLSLRSLSCTPPCPFFGKFSFWFSSFPLTVYSPNFLALGPSVSGHPPVACSLLACARTPPCSHTCSRATSGASLLSLSYLLPHSPDVCFLLRWRERDTCYPASLAQTTLLQPVDEGLALHIRSALTALGRPPIQNLPPDPDTLPRACAVCLQMHPPLQGLRPLLCLTRPSSNTSFRLSPSPLQLAARALLLATICARPKLGGGVWAVVKIARSLKIIKALALRFRPGLNATGVI